MLVKMSYFYTKNQPALELSKTPSKKTCQSGRITVDAREKD
jgi:hypothetical protein